jgi:hypothetical protein
MLTKRDIKWPFFLVRGCHLEVPPRSMQDRHVAAAAIKLSFAPRDGQQSTLVEIQQVKYRRNLINDPAAGPRDG